MNKLGNRQERIHNVAVSGMCGPAPIEKEKEDEVLGYEYVLADEDDQQKELATDRLVDNLEIFGDQYDEIVGYVASPNYREVIEDAFDRYGRGVVFPRDRRALQLTEHFRNSNINELLDHLDEIDDRESRD